MSWRSLMKASRSDAAPNCGKRLFALPPIASCASVPDGATSQIDQYPVSLRSNAIRDPSGDQLGFTLSPGPSNIGAAAAEPSTGTVRIDDDVGLVAAAIAICAPSGDHTGPVRSVPGSETPVWSKRWSAPIASAT